MTRRRGLNLAGGAAAAAVLLLLFWGGRRLGAGWLGDDGGAAAEEAQQRAVLDEVRLLRKQGTAVETGIAALVDRTLGGTLEEVDGALRARLNRLGESEGLRSLVVATSGSSARQTPAKAAYGRSGGQRGLRDEIDFVTLEGSIGGEGTVEQVFRLLQRIEMEPWIKRIDSVRLDSVRGGGAVNPKGEPKGEKAAKRDGGRLQVAVRVTTLFLPGRSPAQATASPWTPEDVAALAPLTEASLFSLPAPAAPAAVAAAPTAPPPAPAPPPFPYEEWMLTGVARGAATSEAWLLNRRSNERRVLLPGEALHEMVFADAGGETAHFTVAGERVAVGVGRALSEATRAR